MSLRKVASSLQGLVGLGFGVGGAFLKYPRWLGRGFIGVGSVLTLQSVFQLIHICHNPNFLLSGKRIYCLTLATVLNGIGCGFSLSQEERSQAVAFTVLSFLGSEILANAEDLQRCFCAESLVSHGSIEQALLSEVHPSE